MDERTLRAIEEADLMSFRDVIERYLEGAIHVETTRVEEPPTLEIGSSRIGGQPDLPRGYDWPRFKGKAHHFLAQFNLSELVGFSCAKVLPRRGMLYFFYDCDQRTWGFDPKDRGSFAVTYVDADIGQLQSTSYPDEVKKPSFLERLMTSAGRFGEGYHPCSVNFRSIHTLPTDVPTELAAVEDKYFEFRLETLPRHYGVEEDHTQHLLGYPTPLQDDMRLECELVANGFYCGNSKPYSQRNVEMYERKANDWNLLFQLDSDENAGMMWGDVGYLYFVIRKQDLARCQFDRTWMILQC